MMLLKIAIRNIVRNSRRSFMTASAITVGAIALILFGEYNDFGFLGLETQAVTANGHLSVFRKGYFEVGSGNPAGYSISNYKSVIALIDNDPVLKPMLHVVTPTVSLFGIAGNFSIDASKTFFGTGFIPSDRDKMRRWDEYGLNRTNRIGPMPFGDGDINHGVVGYGVARVLGLCEPLKIANCPKPPKEVEKVDASAPPLSFDISELAARDRKDGDATANEAREPRLDLLSATANGSPNVVSFYVNEAQNQGVKELDDAYVGMHLTLAQELLYGRGEHKAVSITIQLHRTEDMQAARDRLGVLFAKKGLLLEVRDFTELNASYNQIRGFLTVMFGFLAVIMGTIVIFTVINTMTMTVMERVNEIGTARALGVRRSRIRLQFVIEGCLLGIIGATAGIVLGTLLAVWFNDMRFTYTPPTQSRPVPILLYAQDYALLAKIWISLVLIAVVASVIPATRAAKMKVVDALRHV